MISLTSQYVFMRCPTTVLRLIDKSREKLCYNYKVSRKANITFAACSKIINRLMDLKIVDREVVGRRKMLKLTEKGKELVRLIKLIDGVK